MNHATVAAILESLTQHYNTAQEHFSTSPYNLALTLGLTVTTVVFFWLWRTTKSQPAMMVENKPLEKAHGDLMDAHRILIANFNSAQNSFLNGISKLNADHSITLRTTIEQLSSTDE